MAGRKRRMSAAQSQTRHARRSAAPGFDYGVWKGTMDDMMRKKKSLRTKPRVAPKSVDDYLERVPEPARNHLNKMRAVIQSVIPPEAAETISYGIPAIRHKGILVWFAAFSNHCSLFPTASVVDAFKDELKLYATSKGTIRFPVDRALPVALVRNLLQARVAQVAKK